MESSIDLNQLTLEVLVSTDVYGQFWNVCVWDYNTGTNLLTYKNCSTVSHGLDFIKENYMLCAVYNKPYLIYWNLKGKTQPAKINTPGFVSCLAVSHCGNYIVIGIEEKVFILQTFSGKIISILTQHLQNVTCIKFSNDDSKLITASDDTTILVWDFNEVLTREKEFLKPVYTWNSHSMRINDLFISPSSDRVVSASADLTCKFWHLDSDKSSVSTMSVLFQGVPTRCLLDHSEDNLFVGLTNGNIYLVPLKYIVNEPNKLITDNGETKIFLGHKQKITCLSISSDDCQLASGSEDCNIRIWNIKSRQCLKVITHNGPITNLEFKLRTLFINDEQNLEPTLFSRYVDEKNANDWVCVKVAGKHRETLKLDDLIQESSADSDSQLAMDEYFELKGKFENVKKMNSKIYNLALEKILK